MNFNISKIFNSSTKMPITVGVVSFIAGAGLSAGVNYIHNRRISTALRTTQYEEIKDTPTDSRMDKEDSDEEENQKVIVADQEVEIDSEGTIISNDDPVSDFVERKLEEPIVIVPEPKEVDEEPIPRSVFAGSNDEWDNEQELESRTPDAPYVIHADEFHSKEGKLAQSSYIYYIGDDILVDDKDAPIYNHYLVTGPLKFGHGSGDPNIVYIRNERLKAEYEIVFDPGHYSVEVLGLEAEEDGRVNDLRHSKHVPRFHMD